MNMLAAPLDPDKVITQLCRDAIKLSQAPIMKARKGLHRKLMINRLMTSIERSRDVQHGHLLQKATGAALSLHDRYMVRQQVRLPVYSDIDRLPSNWGRADRRFLKSMDPEEMVEVDLVVLDRRRRTLTLCEIAVSPDHKSHAAKRHISRTLREAQLTAPAWCLANRISVTSIGALMISGQDNQRQPAWLDWPCLGQNALDDFFEVPVRSIVRLAKRGFDRLVDQRLDELGL